MRSICRVEVKRGASWRRNRVGGDASSAPHSHTVPKGVRYDGDRPAVTNIPNRPVRTPGPWRPIVPSVPGRVGKDGWARRSSFVNTAGL